nr:hypothetical protein [Arthrospira sp. PLM2.Bin9]
MTVFLTCLILDTIAPPKPTAQKCDRTPETNSPEVRSPNLSGYNKLD